MRETQVNGDYSPTFKSIELVRCTLSSYKNNQETHIRNRGPLENVHGPPGLETVL